MRLTREAWHHRSVCLLLPIASTIS